MAEDHPDADARGRAADGGAAQVTSRLAAAIPMGNPYYCSCELMAARHSAELAEIDLEHSLIYDEEVDRLKGECASMQQNMDRPPTRWP